MLLGTIGSNPRKWKKHKRTAGAYIYFPLLGIIFIYLLASEYKMVSDLWVKFENNLYNQGVSNNRLRKCKNMFTVVTRGITKDLNKCKRADIEEFVNRLHRNEFKTLSGNNYSGSAKSDIKKFLKQFYKWLHGDGEHFPKSVSWIKTNIRKDERPKEKPVLKIKEVEKLANSFPKVEMKVLTLLLFDSGFRIQELLSAKKKDLTWEKYDGDKKCFWIACNESKTITRKVPVPLFTEDIQQYINSSEYRTKKDEEPLFKLKYNTIIRTLKINSKKLFNVEITPHCCRHSSATYYSKAFDGNMPMIAERYGWSFSSDELKTYIRRSGAYQRAGAKKVFSNELAKIKEKYTDQQEQLDELRKLFVEETRKREKMQKEFMKALKNK